MEIRCLDGCSGSGDRVLEEEESGGKGEEEIRWERKEGSGFREEKGNGKDEEEKQDSGGVKGGEAVDRCAALEERVRVGGDEGLVQKGNEKADNEKVERKVFKAEIGRERKRVEGLGGVGLWGFEEVSGGADEVVETQSEKRG